MNKGGLSHIEVIMAFVIFLGAVSVIFYFFNPIKGSSISEVYVEEIFNGLEKNVSVDLIEIGVKLNNTPTESALPGGPTPPGCQNPTPEEKNKNCNDTSQRYLYANETIGINISKNIAENMNVSIEDLDGSEIMSHFEIGSDMVCVNRSDYYFLPDFIIIKIAEDFYSILGDNDKSNCPNPISYENYKLGGIYSRVVLSEKRILSLNASYYNSNSYAELKKNIGLSANKDFDFEITFLNFSNDDKISGKRNIPGISEVRAINKRVEILRLNGDVQFANVNVRVW
ncbi:MAG: hypothetical protein AABX85_00175 [Nanoarchaeota archaeon]